MNKKETKDLLTTMRERFKLMIDADRENRQNGLELMEFINVPGCQWDEYMKKERGDRPCYEFNKLRITCKRIINEMRANRPAGKVRGVEGSDVDIAKIYDGLIRNIYNISDGDTVTDYAAEYQVDSGMGAWRIVTEYADDSFDQDIKLEAIPNPYNLFCDPADKTLIKKDAKDWILTERISNESFEKRWPKAQRINFDSHEFDDEEDWLSDEETRIAEYWYKEPVKKEIWLLEDGKVIDAESEEAKSIPKKAIKNTRTVETDKIMMCICSGESVLEGPTEWAGSMFPFVQIFGEYFVIDGKVYWHGAGRFSMDAQRSYNIARTNIAETIAQTPQSKFWVTAAQAEGHTDKWSEAHQKNFPFLLYNPDAKAPGPPARMGAADIPVALIQESQIASDEINMTSGIFAADVGQANQASSGRQEIARQQQGQIATFNYQDNQAKGIQRTWELLIDLIPKIYDTERELRILGNDDAEDYVRINQFVPGEDGEMVKINDLSMGKYDVTVTVGPNFTTKRQEATEIYQPMLQSNPELMPIIGDLVFKSMDLPYADDIAERLQAMAPPPIQALMNEGQDIPPEVQQMMQQAQQAMQMVEQQMQQVQQAANEAQIEKSEVEKLIANLKTEQAKFEAKVAQEMAGIAEKDARLTIQKINNESEGVIEASRQQVAGEAQQFNAAMGEEMARSMIAIQELVAQFNQHAVDTMTHIQHEKDEKPKVVKVVSQRVNGNLEAVPVYADEIGEPEGNA